MNRWARDAACQLAEVKQSWFHHYGIVNPLDLVGLSISERSQINIRQNLPLSHPTHLLSLCFLLWQKLCNPSIFLVPVINTSSFLRDKKKPIQRKLTHFLYGQSHVDQKNILEAKYNESSLSCQEALFEVDNNKSYAKITLHMYILKLLNCEHRLP